MTSLPINPTPATTTTSFKPLATSKPRAEIRRDEWGVPYVFSKDEAAAFFAVGYAQAEDHLPNILRNYLLVRGEVSSAFGADFVELDFGQRRWMHLEESRRGFEKLSFQLKKNVEAFTAGIRRYMETHKDEVPEWAPQPEPALAVSLYRTLLWGYATSDAHEVLLGSKIETLAEYASEQAAALQPPRASNEWVLMPWRTEDEAVILLSDPHGEIEGFEMFEYFIEAGSLKSIGVTWPGAALHILGHTAYVAWGLTTGAPQVSDIYEIKVDPQNPTRYRFGAKWREMTIREEKLEVKDGDAVTRTFEYTDHNGILCPVVARSGDKAYVICTSYMHESSLMEEQLYRQQLARDVHEFREALSSMGFFAQNTMVGDTSGNAMYVRMGRVPVRAVGVDPLKPVSGSSVKTAWKGIHPIEDLVQVLNPLVGYMQNNNISPDTMFEGAGQSVLAHLAYPSYIFNDKPGRTNSRGIRCVELMSKTFSASVHDALAIALDTKFTGMEPWQRALREALAEHDPSGKRPEFKRFVQRLLEFDGICLPDSVNALNYYYWRTSIASVPGITERRRIALHDAVTEGKKLTTAQLSLLLQAVEAAIHKMIERHGRTDLEYGDVFRAGRGGQSWPARSGHIDALEGIPWEVRDLQASRWIAPLRVMGMGPPDERGLSWVTTGGRNLRLTILKERVESFSLILFGQSGRPESPHYSDQTRLYSEGKVRKVRFYEEDLAPYVVSTTTLTYQPRP